MKKTLAILFGGRSGEHEVSIRSARSVIRYADPSKYQIVPICIDTDGAWLSPSESLKQFDNETQQFYVEAYGEPVRERLAILGDATIGGALPIGAETSDIQRKDAVAIDVIFPVLHGTYGEDGTIQGLFEMADLPYVGCGVLASSCGMDKAFMKTLFRDAGLPMCEYVWFLRDEWNKNRETAIAMVAEKLGFPCFVKPANLGSSVGISRATNEVELEAAIDLAAEYDRKIIIEEGLDMREIECAVIGNDEPRASLPGEYLIRDASKAFLDFTEKYSATGNNEFVVPSPISDDLVVRVQNMAITAFKAVDGSGLARVDFFLRNDTGALLINEINTLPGLTDASGFPKMWQGTGLGFTEMIDELVELAVERYKDKKRNKTSRA